LGQCRDLLVDFIRAEQSSKLLDIFWYRNIGHAVSPPELWLIAATKETRLVAHDKPSS
jgi:hypothetical protein